MSEFAATKKITKKESIFKQFVKNKELMLLFLPGFILLVVFKYFPIGGLTLAFKDYIASEGIFGSPWIGMENFKTLFSGADFPNVLKNTLVISVLRLLIGFPAPIILALLINEVKHIKYKKLVQTVSYLPYFFSWVVLSGIITMVFSTRGPINSLLMFFGVSKPLEFFADGNLFISLIVSTSVWQSCGWSSVVYLASMSGIDDSLYEAAEIDGASRWKQTLHITIPSIIPTIATVFILNLGSILNAGFDQIYNLYNPAVYEVSDILDTYVLRKMQSMDYGLSTAAGLFKSVISLILVVSSNKLISKFSNDEAGIW